MLLLFLIDTLYQTISYKQTPSIHTTYLHSLLQQNVFNCQLSWLTACNSNSSISVASEASKFSAQVSSLPPLSLPLSSFSCSSISHCISLRRSSFLSAPNFSRTLATSSFRCFSAIDQGNVGTHYLSAYEKRKQLKTENTRQFLPWYIGDNPFRSSKVTFAPASNNTCMHSVCARMLA